MEQKNLINTHCGEKICQRRKQLKYSQEELASAIGLTRTSLVNMEKGRQGITIVTLLKVCAVLKCNVGDIVPNVPSVKLKSIKNIKKIIETKMEANFKW